MAERSNKSDSIFWAALGIASPEERERYLDEACADDPNQRAQLDELLAAYPKVERFLEQPANGDATVHHVPSITERAGTVIGPYKLLQQIGEGGMGVVFMAEQTEPIQRTVALKIIKPGMDTRQVIARFEAERQALAMMDHPNIAKVLDAGTTESGRPYFVMELVKGVPITKYCDEKHLPLRARLELLLPVCQAVQHAHQKGVIHRDIKPTNVLVAEFDDHAVPKVIDFGVAKATSQKLTDRTMFTEFGQVVGTVEYMSPEQAKFNQLDIDTRSDIYSLGVLLYELLTGSTPFGRKRLTDAAFDEALRIIREEEPQKPSTRLSTTDELPSIAANRHSEPARLSKDVRGELDWVVMKALEKDRNRRYDTANGFAADIQRYLKEEAVEAFPPSTLYRLRKYARRHKLGVAAGLAVAAALLLGILGTTGGMIWALRERSAAQASADHATTQATRSDQVAHFLKDMLNGVAPSVALGRDTTMLHEIVDKTAQRLDHDLAGQAAVEADLRATLGDVYAELLDKKNADVMHRRALALRRSLYGENHPDVAQSLSDLGDVAQLPKVVTDAWAEQHELYRYREGLHREALAIRKQLYGDEHPAVAESLRCLGNDLWRQNREAEGIAAYRQALAMQRKLFGNEHLDVAYSLHGLANALHSQAVQWGFADPAGALAEAEICQREALAIERKLLSEPHPSIANSLQDLSWVLQLQNKFAASEALQRELIPTIKKLWGNECLHLTTAYLLLGDALKGQSKLVEAVTAYREALNRFEKLALENRYAGMTRESLGSLLRDQGKPDEAERLHREALKICKQVFGYDNAEVLSQVALDLQAQGKLPEAEAIFREALAIYRKARGNEHPEVPKTLVHLAVLLQAAGRLAESETMVGDALVIQRKAIDKTPNNAAARIKWARMLAMSPFDQLRDPRQAVELATRAAELAPKDRNCWYVLGVAQYRAGEWQLAIEAIEKSMKISPDANAGGWFFLAMAHSQLDHKDEARKWYDKAVEWMDPNQPQNEELRRFRAEAEEMMKKKEVGVRDREPKKTDKPE